MEQNPPEEKRFIANVLDLVALGHELISDCWDKGIKDINPQWIAIAENYLEGYNPVELIETFIKHSYPYWDQIKNHEEQFFIDNAHVIFGNLPIDTSNINAFKLIFTATDSNGNDVVIQEDRDAIWTITESLVKICIKYIHRVRGVKLVQTKDGLRPAYINKNFPKIKVREQANLWNIDLPVPSQ